MKLFLAEISLVVILSTSTLISCQHRQPLFMEVTNRNPPSKKAQAKSTSFFDITMNHSPKGMEVLSQSVVYNRGDAYITKFDLLEVDGKKIHHMVLQSMNPRAILFVWAHNAPGYTLPPDSGISIKNGSKLVLETHYLVAHKNSHCGLRLHLTKNRPKTEIKNSGIQTPGGHFKYIPPGSKAHYVNYPCKVKGGPASITEVMLHTHYHGLEVVFKKMGKQKEAKSDILIHSGDPMKPQVYTKIKPVAVTTGDILALRCLYNTEKEKKKIWQGIGDNEMCNVFYMYAGKDFTCS